MKTWNKVKYPLLIGLIVVLMILFRFFAMAGPSWVPVTLYYPLIAFVFIFESFGQMFCWSPSAPAR